MSKANKGLMVDSMSCIHDLKTNKATDDIPAQIFWILVSLLRLNSDALCIVLRSIDSQSNSQSKF